MSPRIRLSTRYGVNTAIIIVLIVGIIVFIEALSYRHNWRKDFTENKRHSLSEQTLNVLDELDEEIKATVFVWKGSPDYEEVSSLLDLYTYKSDKLAVEMVDPDLNPSRAREYDVGRYGVPVVFFEGAKGSETITTIDEEQATNALIKVTRGQKKVVYFLTGHGERVLDNTEDEGLSVVKKLLENKNYRPKSVLLMREEAVPDDSAILVVCGPEKDITEPEIDAMKRYLENKGRILFLVDPETGSSLKPFLAEYGIGLGDDIVIDRLSRLFGGDYLMPILSSYSGHAITRNFNAASFFAVARSVKTIEKPGVRATWIARTGQGSWAESDIETLAAGKASFDAGKDTPGPVTLAAVSELDSADADPTAPAGSDSAAIAVFGDSDFVTNARVNLSGNADLFMNTINWLGREEALIAIPPRERKSTPIVLTSADARMFFLLPVVLLPGIVLAGGIYAFIRRSRHP